MLSKKASLSSREPKQKHDLLPPLQYEQPTIKGSRVKRLFRHSEVQLSLKKSHISTPNIYDSVMEQQTDSKVNSMDTSKMSPDGFHSPSPNQKRPNGSSQFIFFNKKVQPRYDMTITAQNNLVMNQIKQMKHKNTNLNIILSNISSNIAGLLTYKSEKACQTLIQKSLESHIRFEELAWLFKDSKVKDWSSYDFLFKRILINLTQIVEGRLIMKKQRIEPMFLQIIHDFSEKMDDIFKKLCDESYREFSNSIITERQKLQEKEIEVMQQFASQNKKESYQHLKMILKDKHQINFRAMNSNIHDSLNQFEDRFGQFKMISSNSRFKSNKLDLVMNELIK